MNALTSPTIILPQTLADIILSLDANRFLADTGRRDLISAVNTAARLLGRSPSDLLADVPSLRSGLLKVSPRLHGISDKRFANVKWGLARALVLARILPRKRPKPAPTPAWEDFRAHLTARHLQARLSRFIAFCQYRGIEPSQVTDETLHRFRKELEATLLGQSPHEITKKAAQTWNRVLEINAVDLPRFQVPKTSRYVTAKLDVYPLSIQDDIALYLSRLANDDLSSDEGPTRPLRPLSLVKTKSDIRQTLDAAVAAGVSLRQFRSLADLVNPSVVKTAFQWAVERNGGAIPVGLKGKAASLVAIAKHHAKLPEADIRTLQKIRSRLGKDPVGMSDKNKVRLLQFDDWHSVAALVTLPDKLLERAKACPDSAKSATNVFYAAAITLLLACPIRAKNLAELDIEKNLLVSGKGVHRRYSIWIPGNSVKNGVGIEFQLQAGPSQFLATYIDHFRPRLLLQPSPALLPGRNGTFRRPSALGNGIKSLIRKETGLTVNAHLFRHFAAKLYLEQFPGDYESVRRQLGHRKHDTTTTFYAQFDTRKAQERFAEVILAARKTGKRK